MKRVPDVVLSALLLILQPASGLEPQKEEALVYRLQSYTPSEYATVYAPPQVETIHVMAGRDSSFDPRFTMVYYWPLTNEYFASWDSLDVAVPGRLEVLRGDAIVRVVEREPVAFVYRNAAAQGLPALASGAAAQEAYRRYKEEEAAYRAAYAAFGEKMLEYRRQLREYMRKVREAPTDAPPPIEPQEPSPPQGFVSEPYEAFVLNLPAGEYRIRVRDEAGDVVEGSERRLVAFEPAAAPGIGYDVFAEIRWTAEMRSDDPASDIYCWPGADFYVVPFHTESHWENLYGKLNRPQAPEAPRRILTLHGEPVEGCYLVLTRSDGSQSILEAKPYYVRQLSGSDLGYRILEWSPEVAGKDGPTFTGFHIDSDESGLEGGFSIVLCDSRGGKPLEASRRSVRIVRAGGGRWLWLPSLLPLAAGINVLLARRGSRSRTHSARGG